MLTDAQIDAFIADGFVKVEGAFSAATAAAGREILWRETGCDPDDPATWTQPVIRLWDHAEEPFQRAVTAPVLLEAYDQLVGRGRWLPRKSLGSWPIRFPSPEPPGDAGWHVDVSFQGDADVNDFLSWRVNVFSKGRALLMLFLFSDVGPDDAPTRIRVGSHQRLAPVLRPFGEEGTTMFDLHEFYVDCGDLPEALATGKAGDVYLCHPFLVHAAQPNLTGRPKFMAQPPLLSREPCVLDRPDGAYSPVEQAIRAGLALDPAR
ncbi:phytanoyl-CoA dioxygenase family protein [Nocardia sp. CDC153]|uniref:phytanoyl-CoA dioxygenase family protein n=1 Tax=Nocardia sp. CDC153 TaxID=3112167 RepID=UPI002DBCF094|nr:phytanoyl-CoA dioxygenase family protein [Nocardia sp. CDC153]MEC3955482.1 phytanoyl-CoA dioxygenase family protein [Nocardia sp. CDC153]